MRHKRAEQMQAGMGAHMAIAVVPVDTGLDLGTGGGYHAARRGKVQQVAMLICLGVEDRDLP